MNKYYLNRHTERYATITTKDEEQEVVHLVKSGFTDPDDKQPQWFMFKEDPHETEPNHSGVQLVSETNIYQMFGGVQMETHTEFAQVLLSRNSEARIDNLGKRIPVKDQAGTIVGYAVVSKLGQNVLADIFIDKNSTAYDEITRLKFAKYPDMQYSIQLNGSAELIGAKAESIILTGTQLKDYSIKNLTSNV